MQKTRTALLIALAAATLGYGHLWWRGEALYSEHSDWMAYYLSATTLVHDSVAAGEGVPFWRHDQLSGGPALTNPAIPYTFPLYFLFWVLEPNTAAGLAWWGLFALSGAGFHALGRVLGLGASGLLVVTLAGVFQFKLLLAVYAGWLPYVPTLCLAPWVLAAALALLRRPGAPAALGLALGAGLALVAGWVQLLCYAALAPAVQLGATLVRRVRAGCPAEAARTLGWLATAVALALGLSATFWLPTLLDWPLLSRADPSYAFFLGPHPLGVGHLATFVHPEILGTPLDGSYDELWEDVAYFGIVPLLLALPGAILGWRRPFVPLLAYGFAASVALAFDSPLLRLLWETLPGFAAFRMPGRFLFVASLFGIALAGVGLDELRARMLRGAGGATASAALLTAICATWIVAEGVWHAQRYLTTRPASELVPAAELHAWLARDASPHRIAPISRTVLPYGWSAPLGLELATGYDPYNFRHYQRYFDLVQTGRVGPAGVRVWTDLRGVRRPDLLDALNVKYLVADRPLELPAERFPLEASFRDQPTFAFYQGFGRGDAYVYRNASARPRAFWIGRVVAAADADDALRQLAATDAREAAVVVDAPAEALAAEPDAADADPGTLEVLESAPGRLVLASERSRGGFAVISEVWHPGWRATLDGAPLAVHATNVALLGAWIPAGAHRVELRFVPPGWGAALGLTAIAGVAFVALGVLASGRRQPPAG